MRSEIRAVIDTSTLVRPSMRRRLQESARAGAFTAIWSPWIIAELNRVLVWRWIKDRTGNDLSDANERRCADSAKIMMNLLLSAFELVHPTPPYPPAWETLADEWDHPIWAAAVMGNARYVVSENTNDYPPRQTDGRFVYQGVEYLTGERFLALLDMEIVTA
jgi:hypothetical protein